MFNRNQGITTLLLISLLLAVAACGGSSSRGESPLPTVIEFQFGAGDGWSVGFADYPVGEEEFYELNHGFEQLPEPLADRLGLMVSGNNHSDDLFMFVTRPFTGFAPNTGYRLEFDITFASNAPSGCFGVGGAPGEGVTVKAGAVPFEPQALDDGASNYHMNLDKGNQSAGGSDAITLGDFANTKDCGDEDFSYELKTLTSEVNVFSVMTGAEGTLSVLFGTDSGFEATTRIYYVEGRITATRLP